MIGAHSGSWRRGIALALLLGFVPVASACFGSFNLTRRVYQFNKSVAADKWVRWLVFIAVSPIYPAAATVDLLFANTLEFWTGDNPITAKLEPGSVVGPDGAVVSLVPVESGARIVVTETSGAVRSVTLLREAPGVVAVYDADGALLRRVTGLGGDAPRVIESASAR